VDLVVATFATGASAIGSIRQARLAEGVQVGSSPTRASPPAAVALCTDVGPHRLWVHDSLDLFMVTSPAAAAAVRRYAPRLPVAILPSPVRAAFYQVPAQAQARTVLGVASDARCVLSMGGGWGLGPLVETARALADRGVTVLAVAGHNERLGRSLADAARGQPGLIPFGFTEHIPLLMAAADLVLTTPGATTCSEARVVGRPLMLLDVMPGHGRDNIQHQLELGRADVCDPDPARLVECVLAALERSGPTDRVMPEPDRFADSLTQVLGAVGTWPIHDPSVPPPPGPVGAASVPEEAR
jgi:processive 1,2-diacylglycerol beta-glucosyltransferase